jgi:O-antigen/teichoic acid export membrane protein
MDKKILKWNFAFQYGWVITNVINSLLLLPLYVSHIDADTLGVWLATTSILYWMTVIDPGIGEVLQQKIAELRGKKEFNEIGKLIGSGLIASLFVIVIAIAVGFICYYCVGIILNKDVSKYPDLSKALFVTILATGLSLVSFTLTGINQGLHNSAHVAISSLTANFLFLLVNLVFLLMGFGVMSIAFANFARALYINIFNFISLKRLLFREGMQIIYDTLHFKGFIRIFSFTSTSKIITGLSNSIDMIVLARYISPAMITVYEINKRPINLTSSLIGRHSVALMPIISHAKGMGAKHEIINLVNKQLRLYLYAALFAIFMFAINYFNLINLWIGQGKFIGNTFLALLLLSNFFYLISYFMSNVGYALGDIKKNSQFLIIRNVIFGVLVFFAAKYYGILGTILVSLSMYLFADFFFFSYRVYKLGYIENTLIKGVLNLLAVLVPLGILFGLFVHLFIESLVPEKMFFARIATSSTFFTLFYVVLILAMDNNLRKGLKQIKKRLFLNVA